jgi:predicted transcriptional regulator
MLRDRELPPPLEMVCLNALWKIGEGNVEDVRQAVAGGPAAQNDGNRLLAYTTVLTLLDRLARRGAVIRRKEGRSFRYHAAVPRGAMQQRALRQFLEYHFDGSVEQLKAFLARPDADWQPEAPGEISTDGLAKSVAASAAGSPGPEPAA